MTTGTIDLFEAIYTTRAIRRFKPDAVPDELLRRVLAAGGQAPSGGNRQPWRFIILRSAESRQKVRELLILAATRAGSADPSASAAFADAPVVIIVCAVQPASVGPGTVGPFGQTYPAVENILLAARGLGLGTSITTGFRGADAEFREWLGLPDNIDTTCLMPLGYPLGKDGERHGRKTRRPITELTYEDHWGKEITF